MVMLCVAVGYFFGCFLTAEAVARFKTGKSACDIGTRNPGTVSIGGALGFKYAAVTLLGDIAKTAAACALCRLVLFKPLGGEAVLYAGIGTALGHGFPFWNRFRGGRGVAVTCSYIVFFSPVWGIISDICGLIVVMATKYTALGALIIPVVFIFPAFIKYGAKAGAAAVCGAAVVFLLNRDSIKRLSEGTEKKARIPSFKIKRG